MFILGISAYYHDSAAALVKDGVVIAAAAEERFNRKKHYNGFPTLACQFCLAYASIKIEDVDRIVFYEKPFRKFERIIRTHINYSPYGIKSFLSAMPIWLKVPSVTATVDDCGIRCAKWSFACDVRVDFGNSFGIDINSHSLDVAEISQQRV